MIWQQPISKIFPYSKTISPAQHDLCGLILNTNKAAAVVAHSVSNNQNIVFTLKK